MWRHSLDDLVVYPRLTVSVVSVNLVMDLHITHTHSNPGFNDNLHFPLPSDIDRSLNETVDNEICEYGREMLL